MQHNGWHRVLGHLRLQLACELRTCLWLGLEMLLPCKNGSLLKRPVENCLPKGLQPSMYLSSCSSCLVSLVDGTTDLSYWWVLLVPSPLHDTWWTQVFLPYIKPGYVFWRHITHSLLQLLWSWARNLVGYIMIFLLGFSIFSKQYLFPTEILFML